MASHLLIQLKEEMKGCNSERTLYYGISEVVAKLTILKDICIFCGCIEMLDYSKLG